MSKEYTVLLELYKQKSIKILVHKNSANNYFYRNYLIGKVLNILTPILLVTTIILTIFNNILFCMIGVLVTIIYTFFITKIASIIVRNTITTNELLFEGAYNNRTAMIYDVADDLMVSYPENWKEYINLNHDVHSLPMN